MLMDLGLLLICATPMCIVICITIYKCTKTKYENIDKEDNENE